MFSVGLYSDIVIIFLKMWDLLVKWQKKEINWLMNHRFLDQFYTFSLWCDMNHENFWDAKKDQNLINAYFCVRCSKQMISFFSILVQENVIKRGNKKKTHKEKGIWNSIALVAHFTSAWQTSCKYL